MEGEPAMEYVCGVFKSIKDGAKSYPGKQAENIDGTLPTAKNISVRTVESCLAPDAMDSTMYRNYATEAKTSWQIFPRCAQTVTPRKREATAGERSASVSRCGSTALFLHLAFREKNTGETN